MKRLRARVLFIVVIAFSVIARTAGAQSTCPTGATWCVGTDGRIIIAPPAPTIHVDPGVDARARAEAEARARAEADARARAEYEARLQAEITRVLAWQAYLSWQVRVRAEVETAAGVALDAEARAAAARYPDRWATTAIPALGPRPDRVIGFGRTELAPLSLCAAVFSGHGLPSYIGACVPLRFRFDESWSLLFDTSFVFERYGDTLFHSVGLHPALAWSFARGRGDLAGSHAFVRAGVDGQLPVDGGAMTPDTYVGAHVGLGVHAQVGDVYGLGLELRGLLRGGTNAADDGAARARFGAELRVNIVTLAW